MAARPRTTSHGQDANLLRQLHEAQRARAEQHRDRDDLIEDAIEGLPEKGRFRLGEIVMQLGGAVDDVTQRRLAIALRNAGWEQTCTINGRYWERRMTPHDAFSLIPRFRFVFQPDNMEMVS